ncbi:MAG: helix-turn-helix transcriptional regulator [Clostridia bacterium]|nr:helix-turn-helix transcriptional regulator [Clostridia bacterium]
MNTKELQIARIRRDKDRSDVAGAIGMSRDLYAKKERGCTKFDPDQIAAIQNYLDLTPEEFNSIFFDGKLLFGKPLTDFSSHQ